MSTPITWRPAPRDHKHNIDDVNGLAAALDGASGTAAWGEVSGKPATYPPSAHTHSPADVTGLVDRLAALEYKSGERDITSLVTGRAAGRLLVERVGRTVWMTFDDLKAEDQGSSYYSWTKLLPAGWCPGPAAGYRYLPLSPTAAGQSNGPIRVSRYGDLGVYDAGGQRALRGTVSWTTPDPVPTTPFGSPT